MLTKQDLENIPLIDSLAFLVKELKNVVLPKEGNVINFERKIHDSTNTFLVEYIIEVNRQAIFRNTHYISKAIISSREVVLITLETADNKFLSLIISHLLLHRLPSVIEMVEYQQWKGYTNK